MLTNTVGVVNALFDALRHNLTCLMPSEMTVPFSIDVMASEDMTEYLNVDEYCWCCQCHTDTFRSTRR